CGVRRALPQKRLEIGNDNGIHKSGARRLQLRDILLKNGIDFLEVVRSGFRIESDRFAEDADTCASESALVQLFRVTRWSLSDAQRRDGVFRIVAHHRIQQLSEIFDRSRHRSHLSCRGWSTIPHTTAAYQTWCGPQAGHGIPPARSSNGSH